MSSTTLKVAQAAGEGRVALRKLLWVGPLAVAAAIVANLIALLLATAVLPLPAGFPPLTPGAVAFFTLLGTGLGVLVFAVIARLSQRPLRTFRTVAIVALLVSVIPNLALAANPSAAPFPGGTALAFLTLILFHVVAAVVSVLVLTNLARAK